MISFYLTMGMVLAIVFLSVRFGHRDLSVEKLKEKYANNDSRFIGIEGMPVHYRIEGNDTDTVPLLLLHGAGSSLHTWDMFVKIIGNRRKVIRIDLPAYGLTGPTPHRHYSIESYTKFIVAFLDMLKIAKCDFVGNSLGGYISWAVALTRPSMVRKLVLIDAVVYPMKKTERPLAFKLARIPVLSKVMTFITPRSIIEKSVLNLYAGKSKVTNVLVDRYFELTLREGNRQAFIDISSNTTQSELYTKISQIKQPTLIIWGAEDKFVPLENAHKFKSDIPKSILEILPSVGHLPMEESPAKTVELVLQFTSSE